MKIEILGVGCTKCKALEQNVHKAIVKIDGFHVVEKVEDIQKIMDYGVISTPGLVVDGVVKSSGKLLTPEEILKLLK